MEEDLSAVFKAAYAQVYMLLTDLYENFKTSDIYDTMVDDLSTGELSRDNLRRSPGSSSGSIYPMRAAYSVLDYLSIALDDMEKFYEESSLSSKRSSIRMNRSLRRFAHIFCEQRLGVDFTDNCSRITSMLTEDANSSHRSSIISVNSQLSNFSQSNSASRRKDALDFF